MAFETVSVIGLGYIGLPTAAMFASRKKKVIGVDVDEKTVSTINQGQIHIVEPELDMIVHAGVTEGYLRAVTKPEPADAFLVAVPTPFLKVEGQADVGISSHQPDLSYIEAAANSIAPILQKGNLVILESTSPVGATEQMAEWLAEARPDLTFPHQVGEESDVNIAHCPERVLPGHVVRELVENDRVIGGITQRCSERSIELYQCFVQGECVVTNARTAEMAKLTENASRDVSIAFANELSMICDELDINVWELIKLANRHPRVNILQPGPGVGGHCIAVDPWFIVSKTPEQAKLIHTARLVNDGKPEWVIHQVKEACFEVACQKDISPHKLAIACLGLSFKANIDDLRESPALEITKAILQKCNGPLLVVEPNITKLPDDLAGENVVLSDMESAIEKSDVLVLLVDHKEFIAVNKEELAETKVIDTRGVWV